MKVTQYGYTVEPLPARGPALAPDIATAIVDTMRERIDAEIMRAFYGPTGPRILRIVAPSCQCRGILHDYTCRRAWGM